MLIKSAICPICERTINHYEVHCLQCGCIIQFTLDPPVFIHAQINEPLVQVAIDRCREQLGKNAQDGLAQYVLGLGYLNLGLTDQGCEALNQAIMLLPEKHLIRFELAILLSSLQQYLPALSQITQALKLSPEERDYQYLQHYLNGMIAQERGDMRSAVMNWIAAYQLAPEIGLASTVIQQFVAAFEAKLTQPIAHSLRGLEPNDAADLQLWNSKPVAQKQALPRAPKAPGNLDKVSMGLLRKVSPARAGAIEQLHAERISAYQAAATIYESKRQMVVQQHEAQMQEWYADVQELRSDLLVMARLCLAVFEEEERCRKDAEQRQQAEQHRRAQLQAQRMPNDAHKVSTCVTHQLRVREKQYLSTKAIYLQGLPKGKEWDAIQLTVSNVKIAIRHSSLFGAWEHTIPIETLIEVSGETVKHLLSSEKRLRISYHDAHGMIANAIFTNLKVDDCVKKILQARSSQ